ncbi:MAG: TIGR04002 family protein [Clostridiales bacterium]|nr:TIGR04002 family protein [Clostridiales bacterium]
MKSKNLRKILLYCYTALFTSTIFIATTYLPRFSIGIGYIHIGDAFIYIAASLLPPPLAVFAAATGASLADLISGHALWIPATAVIKGVTALCFTSRSKSIICRRNLFALICAALFCCGGYYLYESLIVRNFLAPLAYIIPNLLQSVASALLYLLLATIIERVPHIKNQFTFD